MNIAKAFRGHIFDFSDKAHPHNLNQEYRYFEDGLLVVENGMVKHSGEFNKTKQLLNADVKIEDHSGCYILPGFVDAHVHSVQTQAIASYGKELLDWLDNYIFPNERHFENPEFADRHIDFFTRQLLKNGTTTAMVYSSVHDASVNALFRAAEKYNMRMITGNTWMDRNAPDYLLKSPEESYNASKTLIEKWHNKARLHFALTPRYAITSSPESLKVVSTLLKEYDDDGLYLQTHISENKKEVELVNHSYPGNHHYLDVYDSYGLLTPRTLLGHGIYLSEDELKRISQTGSSIVHCPSSNLFLGSGLLNLQNIIENDIHLAIGSDVAGGTSFSMLRNLHDAYTISALNGIPMNPLLAIYLITLGGARALDLDDRIGNFDVGKEADFVVIDTSKNELLSYRLENAHSIEEILFAIVMLGDEKVIKSTCLMGESIWRGENGLSR
nr:guanine deaminase [Bacteroidota bacterium]